MGVVICLAALAMVLCVVMASDGCALSCNGVKHTMCEYPPGGGDACKDHHGGLTSNDVQTVVDLHNEMRQRIASGETTAGDMREMSWDPRAAEVAQRWADQCGARGHDQCRRVQGETHVGQNVCLVSGSDSSGPPTSSEALSSCVTAWYEEVVDFRGYVDDFDPDPEEVSKIGHYTQLAWAATDRLGCGLSQYAKGAEYQYRLVCNYLPGGNVVHGKVYSRGEPCSQCPVDTRCSEQWPGLCAGTAGTHAEDVGLPHSEPVLGVDVDGGQAEDTVRDAPSPDTSCVASLTHPVLLLLSLIISLY